MSQHHPDAPRRKVYRVNLNPEGYDPATADPFDEEGITSVVVPVIHADQMVGEREAAKMSLTLDLPQNVTSVIVWCALRRRSLYTGTYHDFRDRDCVSIENASRPSPEGEVVPPTEGSSGSASTSPGTSPASESTGSTQTSTTAS